MTQSPGHDPESSGQPPYPSHSYPYGQQPYQQPYQQPPPSQHPGYGYPAGPPPYSQQGAAYGYQGYGQYSGGPGMYGGGIDPVTGRPLSDKSKIVAGVLQLLLGTLGAGRFYTGHTGMAVGQLLTCGGFGVWALIDGILLLVNGGTDSDGRVLRSS